MLSPSGGGQTLWGCRVSVLNLRILRQDLAKLMCLVYVRLLYNHTVNESIGGVPPLTALEGINRTPGAPT